MALEPVLIGGEWRQAANPAGSFAAIDPSTGKNLPEAYPVSGADDVAAAFRAAGDAVVALRAVPVENIARFLEDYAARIEASADALVARAARETGLPESPRLRAVELPRTTNQLRQGAAAARDRSWCAATIDTKANMRSYYGPLGGPVVVFGPNNFPYALQLRRGRRLRRGDRRRQSGHRQGQHRPPGDQPAARDAGRRGGARGGAAARDGAAHLPDAARRGLPARVAPVGGRDRVHGQQERRPQAEAGGRRRRQADLPRDVEHQPGVRAAGRARGAIGRRRQGAVRFVRDGRRAVLHAAGPRRRPGRRARRGVHQRAGARCSPPARRARCWARRGRRRSPRRWTSWWAAARASSRAATLSPAIAPPSSRRCCASRRRRSSPTRTRCRPRRSAP